MSVKSEVLAELRDGNTGSARQIAEGAGMPVDSVRRALGELEVEGLVWSDTYQQRARVYGLVEEG